MPRVFVFVPTPVHNIIDRVVDREGGYVDHPNDPGGATNMGITFATLERWREKPITKFDVRNLTKSEAVQIYYSFYWMPAKLYLFGDQIWVKEFIFDWIVNAGFRNPTRQIQRMLGVRSDGIIGPVTAHTLIKWMLTNKPKSASLLCDLRIKWYIRLAVSKHKRIVFIEGWFNRANDLRYLAPPYIGN